MRKIISTAVAVLFITLGVSASAEAHASCGRRTHGVNRREQRQQRRVMQGVRSGELTGRETLRLEREQLGIRRQERRAKSDGVVTARERVRLQRELSQSSRHIYRAKHNERDRN